MTNSNRIANRVLLLLVGIVALASGALLAARASHRGLPFDPTAPTSGSLWITAAAALVVVLLCLVWILTRGRGRTATLAEVSDPQGSTSIDVRVAADLIADALRDNPDVASVGSGGYLMRRSRVLSLRLVVRKGADLPAIIRSVEVTVDQLDEVLETRLPVLLQVVGTRTSLTRAVRVR